MALKGLSIGDVVARTGVAESTLRMWERRHGFPVPDRLPGGHRRYSEDQVDLVRQVVAARVAGLSLPVAIERARRRAAVPVASLYAEVRRRRADIEPRTISRPILAAFSHAIEDESLARAERPILFACFQREGFYRREQARWRQLAQGARLAVVFADFGRAKLDGAGPAELRIEHSDPIAREWAIVCDAERHAAFLCGREPPSSDVGMPPGRRVFEVCGASSRRWSGRPPGSAPSSLPASPPSWWGRSARGSPARLPPRPTSSFGSRRQSPTAPSPTCHEVRSPDSPWTWVSGQGIQVRRRRVQVAMRSGSRIAIVGAGVSGLVAAHELHRQHQITVFEANPYAGGHTNTVRVESDPARSTSIPASSSTTTATTRASSSCSRRSASPASRAR